MTTAAKVQAGMVSAAGPDAAASIGLPDQGGRDTDQRLHEHTIQLMQSGANYSDAWVTIWFAVLVVPLTFYSGRVYWQILWAPLLIAFVPAGALDLWRRAKTTRFHAGAHHL